MIEWIREERREGAQFEENRWEAIRRWSGGIRAGGLLVVSCLLLLLLLAVMSELLAAGHNWSLYRFLLLDVAEKLLQCRRECIRRMSFFARLTTRLGIESREGPADGLFEGRLLRGARYGRVHARRACM